MPANEDHVEVDNEEMVRLTAEIVAAYVSCNPTAANDIPDVVRNVHSALVSLAQPEEPEPEPQKPAVPIRRSVTDDYIICLEDGAKLKMLKRYLRTRYNMTPDEYRAKWGLPSDYPMVAPSYAKARSEFARKIGLGRPSAPAPRKRGGRKRSS